MKNCTRTAQWIFLVCLIMSNMVRAQTSEEIKPVKIWDGAQHSAFTDLIRFKNNFYCSFREGSGHVPGAENVDGTVRILKSADGIKWESAALLKKEGVDLRDPKLSITPDGRLMIIIGGSIYKDRKLLGRNPHVSFSDKTGTTFSEPEKVITDPGIASWGSWYWRVTWYKGTGYAIDYQIGPEERRGPSAMYLVATKDGKAFKKVSKLEIDGFPNEATIRFDKSGTMHVMVRRELEDMMGTWATSKAPFADWKFTKMNVRLGGPNFIFTNDGHIIAGTRVYGTNVYTGLFTREAAGTFKEIYHFPSSGDNSYPGLVIYDKKLWVSYYSSHEGKTSIYLAVIPMKDLKSKL
ncbi:hypothetical protein DYBT9275_05873 [Dyadobacter sp. CECT 9275]|uniref:Exo-alpha-sialidase n=1 Tax=Dyadobacter helix TaxID=2822344 RepID=A0A916NE71_9BACT|nr:hypothetical protein [Dyadobacter sp. CECT 9275]CAG5017930.1 hypothetical protein DYBT9275_05873 [Dyadobacter sp. CECT 9275]